MKGAKGHQASLYPSLKNEEKYYCRTEGGSSNLLQKKIFIGVEAKTAEIKFYQVMILFMILPCQKEEKGVKLSGCGQVSIYISS